MLLAAGCIWSVDVCVWLLAVDLDGLVEGLLLLTGRWWAVVLLVVGLFPGLGCRRLVVSLLFVLVQDDFFADQMCRGAFVDNLCALDSRRSSIGGHRHTSSILV